MIVHYHTKPLKLMLLVSNNDDDSEITTDSPCATQPLKVKPRIKNVYVIVEVTSDFMAVY